MRSSWKNNKTFIPRNILQIKVYKIGDNSYDVTRLLTFYSLMKYYRIIIGAIKRPV